MAMSLRISFRQSASCSPKLASRAVRQRGNRLLRSLVQSAAFDSRGTSVGRLPVPSLHGRLGHPHVLVRAAVIKEPAVSLTRHAFHKNNVGHLPDPFPFFFWREDWLPVARKELARVVAI